jgi:hypothetical protein
MVAMIEPVCLYLCICACLDCEEELSYSCDCCECAGCGQASDTNSSTHFDYCISVFSSMHVRWNINWFYKMIRS